MGRYYNTGTGREGKFMFAIQESTDPEYMGMHEQGASYINYYADKKDEEIIRKRLDEEYDALKIPKKDRIYYIKQNDYMAQDKYEKEHFYDKVFDYVKLDDTETIQKYDRKYHRFSSDREGYECFASFENALHLARIRLALVILSDIKDDGYCDLEAEC